MRSKYIWLAYAMVWFSTSVAVSTAIYITKTATPLWAMLIPTFVSLKSESDEKE